MLFFGCKVTKKRKIIRFQMIFLYICTSKFTNIHGSYKKFLYYCPY